MFSAWQSTRSTLRLAAYTGADGQYGLCLASSVAGTSIDDGDVPPPGDGYAYLIQIDSTACGVGTLGDGTSGQRVNGDSASCH